LAGRFTAFLVAPARAVGVYWVQREHAVAALYPVAVAHAFSCKYLVILRSVFSVGLSFLPFTMAQSCWRLIPISCATYDRFRSRNACLISSMVIMCLLPG